MADCSACARDCRRRLPDIMTVGFVDSLLSRIRKYCNKLLSDCQAPFARFTRLTEPCLGELGNIDGDVGIDRQQGFAASTLHDAHDEQVGERVWSREQLSAKSS